MVKVKHKWTKILLVIIIVITMLVVVPSILVFALYSCNGVKSADPAKIDNSAKVKKIENVYVTTRSNGKPTHTIVDVTLKNGEGKGYGRENIEDYSTLDDILISSNGIKPETADSGDITWEANGYNVSYTGTTKQDPPVTMNIKYYLNGKEVQGKDLYGEDGKLKIVMKFKSNVKETIEVKGEEQEVKVPFLCLVGMELTNKSFTGVTINNGKVIKTGKFRSVAGLASAGVSKSMSASMTAAGISDTIIIEGNIKDYKGNQIITYTTPDFFDKVPASKLKAINNANKKVRQLDRATLRVQKGAIKVSKACRTVHKYNKQLANGTEKAAKGSKQLSDGVKKTLKQLDKATTKLSDAAKLVSTCVKYASQQVNQEGGLKDQADGIAAYLTNQPVAGQTASTTLNEFVEESIDELEDAKKELEDERATLRTEKSLNPDGSQDDSDRTISAINESIKIIDESIEKQKEVMYPKDEPSLEDATIGYVMGERAKDHADKVDKLGDFLNGETQITEEDIPEDLKKLLKENGYDPKDIADFPGLEDASAGVTAGLFEEGGAIREQLSGKKGTVTGGAKELVDAMRKLDKGAGKLDKGSAKLSKGAEALARGTGKYYQQAIKKIINIYDDNIKALAEDINKGKKAARKYETFSGKSGDMKDKMTFLYYTNVCGE